MTQRLSVFTSAEELQKAGPRPTSCAIGMFDGVHLGHQAVLKSAIAEAKTNGWTPAVFSFTNHPQTLFSAYPSPLLSNAEERLEQFERLGIELALMMTFDTALQQLDAQVFVETLLVNTLQVKSVSIGTDHHFGRNRSGNGAFLQSVGPTIGFDTRLISPVQLKENETEENGASETISSTRIRQALAAGDLDLANRMLGRPYQVTGTVERGFQRGQELNFPTANLALPAERLLPANGVYVMQVQVQTARGESSYWQPAVGNIGLAPTFDVKASERRLEVHLLDYSGPPLYGETLSVTFVERLREERRFESIDGLIAQIQYDISAAQQVLSHVKA